MPATPRQKDNGKSREVACEPARILVPTGRSPITFKLRGVKIVKLGDDLKRAYRIKN